MNEIKETSITVEVVYRGIFQKTLAQRICRSIVLAARKRGHTGTAFARYGDSPERNGVPAKQFAVVAIHDRDHVASCAEIDPPDEEVSTSLDDTLGNGVGNPLAVSGVAAVPEPALLGVLGFGLAGRVRRRAG